MANTTFQLRRSSVAGKVPNTSTLSIGELGINLTDKILYSSDGSAIFEIGANNTNVNISGNLTVKAINANGSLGTNGQVLTSNGSATYWSSAAGGGGFSNGQSISVNNFVVTGSFTANGTTGTDGQFLASNASAVYWSNSRAISVYYQNNTLAFAATGATTYVTGANSQIFFNESNSVGASAGFTFNNSTNTLFVANSVGIGTSSPTSVLEVVGYSSGAMLRATGTQSLGASSGGGITLLANLAITATDQRIGGLFYGARNSSNTAATFTGGITSFSDGTWTPTSQGTSLRFETTSIGATTRTEKIRITADGNVGIGTSAPEQKLRVIGTSGTPQFGAGTATNAVFVNVFDNASIYMTASAIDATSFGFGAASNIPLFFLTNNAERMRIDASGNVGIANTSPGSKLTVSGTIESTTGGIKFPDGSIQTSAGASTGKAIAMAIVFGG